MFLLVYFEMGSCIIDGMINHRTELTFFLILTGIVLVLLYFIFQPYLAALFFALVFYIVFEPVYHFFSRFCFGKKSIAAFLTIVSILVIIFFPFIFFGYFLFEDALDLYGRLQNGQIESGVIPRAFASLEEIITRYIPAASVNIEEYVNGALGSVLSNLSSFFSKFFGVLIQLVITLFALFFFFKDGAHFKEKLYAASPLSDTYDKQIWTKVRLAVNSVVRGSLSVALIQGMLTGLGFALFGVPSPFVWGAMAAVAALIPAVGTALVLIPAILYLFFTGDTTHAIGLLVWGVVAVGLIDNFLGPIFIKRGIKIHPLLILLSVLGGLSFFGPVGFLAGPVILSVFLTMLELFPAIIGGGVPKSV